MPAIAPITEILSLRIQSTSGDKLPRDFDPAKDVRKFARISETESVFNPAHIVKLADGTILLSAALLSAINVEPDRYTHTIGRARFSELLRNFDALAYREQCTQDARNEREACAKRRDLAIIHYVISLI